MSKYQILSLDGGGIRGVVTARLLERLAMTRGLEGVFDHVELIAGNSSGALIALGMSAGRAVGKPMRAVLPEIRQLFDDGDHVFGPRWPIWLGGLWWWSRYQNDARREQLDAVLQKAKLRDLGTKVVITTFDLDNEGTSEEKRETAHHWKPKIFHNFRRADGRAPKGRRPTDRSYLVRDVALYSSAAPVYFPTVDGYIDGGVYANNPSMCALAQVLDARYEPTPKPPLDEISMFSVGAGVNAFAIKGATHDWGAMPWGLHHYVELTTDATVDTANYQCRQLLGHENYHRCNVEFPDGVSFALDATDRVEEIRDLADACDLSLHIDWLKRHWAARPAMVTVPGDVTSKHLLGATELTCLFPIRTGFVDAFETHTYTTRLQVLLRVLHGLRQASREAAPVRVFPDIVERIRSIDTFRLNILPNNYLLLAVNFDRPWEPYMRTIWRDLGALIDLILCNCEGYDGHQSANGFEPFAAYIRGHQVETDLFYVDSAHTIDDVRYLTQLEQLVREHGGDRDFDVQAAELRMKKPDDAALESAAAHPDEVIRQGLLALSVLYLLTELYREGTPDGDYLKAAVVQILSNFAPTKVSRAQQAQYERELAWFASTVAQPKQAAERTAEIDQIQGGILQPYKRVTHGCMLLARIEDPVLARGYLSSLLESGYVTPENDRRRDRPYVNVAFTCTGLKQLGLSDDDLVKFPKEFREGMDARAGMLGDTGGNHPDHWQLPPWNWMYERPGERDEAPPAGIDGVRLSTIDLVLDLRAECESTPDDHLWTRSHPLRRFAQELVATPERTGIRVLTAEPLIVLRRSDRVVEHFGYRDGISQPRLDRPSGGPAVPVGDLVLGYPNSRGDQPFLDADDPFVLPGRERGGLLDNGSFLVVRKLEQHVETLHRVVERFVSDPANGAITIEEAYAKLMGRSRGGHPAAKCEDAAGNTFDYAADTGIGCPLHAHIRRGNPREDDLGVNPPRIARRAMSYGPPVGDGRDNAERGMMFLAYNASIADQYEVIQRWMTAGNSTGEFSGRTDPLLRVTQPGRDDIFLVPHGNGVLRMHLGDEPFVSLRWGLYLFVPSLAAIAQLARRTAPDQSMARELPLLGQTLIDTLRSDDDWDAVLSDSSAQSSGRTAAVCAAIRERHGGAMRTSDGGLVLVASHDLAASVLGNDRLFSVSEYRNRMLESFGDIYLGHDKGEYYDALSARPNEAIASVTQDEAFRWARATTCTELSNVVDQPTPVRLSLESLIDGVLATLSEVWFGVPDGTAIKVGGKPDPAKVTEDIHCPFHYVAPSRYIFSSPRPRNIVTTAGESFGDRLREQTIILAHARLDDGRWPKEMPPITRAVWETAATYGGGVEQFASLLVGVMEGFLPTVYGNFLKTTYAWMADETFWRVQQDLMVTNDRLGSAGSMPATLAVLPAMKRAMQLGPVPDMIYRTATQRCLVGNVLVEPGDRIVVLISSVTQELLERNVTGDVYPVFGGNRRETGHPTHACPGYDMGMGVLLGALTALLEAGTFAPTETLFVVEFRPPRREVAQPPLCEMSVNG